METILPITLSFFGTPRLERDKNIPIHLARRKSLALLVYLAVTSQPQSRDTLAALLWPDYDSSSARANLRRALADLRQVLKKNCLVVEREHIQLICNPNLRMDVAEFTDRITKWRDHAHARLDCSECQIVLKEAISLYTADFLAGFTLPDCPEFDNWHYQQREMLRSDLLAALAWLVEAHEAKNEYIAAIAYARRWISVDPLHENAHYTLMRLFALSGQRSAALRQYAECEHLLKEGLGITPQKETRELFRAIMQKCDLAPITTGSTIENASSQRYQLREKIRQDEMGAVYRAFDTILEREVAIKLLEKATLDAEGRANLLREARTAAKLNHPNIISVFDAGELNGTPFLVRELAEGDTLRDRLSAPLDEKLRWMVQICKALEHAHGLGILHCGLTFENIFISTDGRVRLADFGLARSFESPQFTQKHRLEETSPYLAPEQLNNGEVGVRTDLYALGVIFYELVTGNMPFVGQNPVFIITQDPHVIPTAHIQINPQIPTSLEILIQQLLHKLPEDRPGSATEVRQALEKLLQVNPLTGQIIDPQARLKMPIHVIPFISREDLLTEIQERLTDPECRLLTLVGPGGSGKTRLALETGKQQEGNFANGVFFVSLEPLSSVDAMPSAIAEAMNFSFYKGVMGEQTLEPKQQVINYLKRKSVLLILDNFEHLLEGSEITTEILQAAPGVKIIATSRARLNVFEEHTCLIPGMQYPVIEEQPINKQVLKEGLEFCAIKLFVQAAGWAQPEFALSEKNLPDVVHICRLVEGMPLGIILSAAWLCILSLEEIAAEIEKGLDILEGELRDLPDRQRSLRAVFDSSWRLLGEREQKVFAALSVFRGGCTRIAAQQVTGASLKELMTLVNCSLIQREASGRYTMHRLLHQYAEEKLSEDQVSQRIAFHHHSDYFTNRLVDWEKDLISSRQAEALNEMDAEHENCQAAWQQALEQKDITRLSSMLGALHRYYCLRQRHHEGESIFHQAAENIAEITSPEGLRLLCGLLARQADLKRRPLDLAMEFFDQAQDALDSLGLSAQDTRRERADFLRLKANILQETDQHILRKDSLEESLELYRELDDRWAIAEVMRLLGEHNWWIGSLDQSTLYYEQSVTRFQALGDPSGAGLALTMLAAINMGSDPIDKSEEMQREALALFRKTGDPFGQYHSLAMLGVLYILFRADFNRARTFIKEARDICYDFEMRGSWIFMTYGLGHIELCLGDYSAAQELFLPALVLAKEMGNFRALAGGLWELGIVELLEGDFGKANQTCQESLRIGRTSYAQDQLAMILSVSAMASLLIGHLSQAEAFDREALQIIIETRSTFMMPYVWPAIVMLLTEQGKVEWALELQAMAAEHFPFVARAKYIDVLVGERLREAAAALPAGVAEIAQEHGRKRDLWATSREVLTGLGN